MRIRRKYKVKILHSIPHTECICLSEEKKRPNTDRILNSSQLKICCEFIQTTMTTQIFT